jgi:hypothetical protein
MQGCLKTGRRHVRPPRPKRQETSGNVEKRNLRIATNHVQIPYVKDCFSFFFLLFVPSPPEGLAFGAFPRSGDTGLAGGRRLCQARAHIEDSKAMLGILLCLPPLVLLAQPAAASGAPPLALAEYARAFHRGDYARATALATERLKAQPADVQARIILARAESP